MKYLIIDDTGSVFISKTIDIEDYEACANGYIDIIDTNSGKYWWPDDQEWHDIAKWDEIER